MISICINVVNRCDAGWVKAVDTIIGVYSVSGAHEGVGRGKALNAVDTNISVL
jgi:hypothetical protein